MDDWQLLNDYAINRSEDAFCELVERHSGMVYHTALRQTGNSHAAQEAAQAVFIALAQKAGRIHRQASLHGWLFGATRYAVLNQARQNSTRQRHEQEVIAMRPILESNDAEIDSTWEHITPHLNDALERLPAADRDVVLIRFFGNKSHKEVAAAMGVSEETARKRLSRALERLRAIFARRGVVVSSVALAAALAARGTQAAPGDLTALWTKVAMAKAAAGTVVASGGGLLAFLMGGKVAVPIAALVLAGAIFAVYKSSSQESPPAPQLTLSPTPLETNQLVATEALPPKPAAETAVPAAALDKVSAALHDTNETTVYPNAVMQEAIAGLNDKKKAALPILEKGLTDTDAEVRLRAVDGLGIVGPEAGEAAPLVLKLLKDGVFWQTGQISQTRYKVPDDSPLSRGGEGFPIYTDNILLYVLGQIHPAAQFLPEFARSMQESTIVSGAVVQAEGQFPAYQRTLVRGSWLWEMAGRDTHALNAAWRPLLQDTNLRVQAEAALALVGALGDQADAGVFSVAIALMKTNEASFGLTLLQGAARDLNSGAPDTSPILYASRLGPYLNDTVSALGNIAYQSNDERSRLTAEKMLNILVPDLAKSNPTLAAELEQEKEENEFVDDATSGRASTPEILAGLKKYPKAAPSIARNFSDRSNAVEFLPAFAEALTALKPAPDASPGDLSRNFNQRGILIDAMQKLAPDQPKLVFTVQNKFAIGMALGKAGQADVNLAQKIAEAEQAADWQKGRSSEISPDQMRKLLTAIKEADATTYAALLAKVKEIDPHFSEDNAGSVKAN